METPRTGKARFVGGIGEGGTVSEPGFGVFERQVLPEFLGTHARPFGEKTLEMKLAQVRFFGQFTQGRLLPEVGGQVLDGAGNLLVGVGVVRVHFVCLPVQKSP